MIGIKDQIVDYGDIRDRGGIENKIFQLKDDDNFYLILDERYDLGQINKINTLLKDNEIFGAVITNPTIFTYIIGTQMEYKEPNILVRDDTNPPETNQICDVDKMHIWAKIALSTQEINTKHNNIIIDSYKIYENINKSIINKEKIDDTDLFNGVIDRIYYAGELAISKDKDNKNDIKYKVNINFLSGTYMAGGGINATNPPEQTINCIKKFFTDKFGATSVTISHTTFINNIITRHLLDEYIRNANLQVGVFKKREDAIKYKNKKLDLAKIQGQINKQIQLKTKFENNAEIVVRADAEINKLTKQNDALMIDNFNMIKYTVPVLGGKRRLKTKRKTKTKTKRKTKTKTKTKKQNCCKIYNKRSNKY